MAENTAVVERAATSWGAVVGGWLATIGASVVFAPAVAGLIAAAGVQGSGDLAMAVPVVLGILLSYVVGGYVAGRMAGYRSSWHGMMTAFFTLLILLVVLLVGGLADRGLFAASGVNSLHDLLPGLGNVDTSSLDSALSFGAILGFLAAIFGGWLGGLLAPAHAIPVTPVAPSVPVTQVTRTDRHELAHRPRRSLISVFGRKGGDRVERKTVDEVHTSRIERS